MHDGGLCVFQLRGPPHKIVVDLDSHMAHQHVPLLYNFLTAVQVLCKQTY